MHVNKLTPHRGVQMAFETKHEQIAAIADSPGAYSPGERNQLLHSLHQEAHIGEGARHHAEAARTSLQQLDEIVARVRATGEKVVLWQTFEVGRDRSFTIEEALRDPVAKEIWERVSSGVHLKVTVNSEKIWSNSPDFPYDPTTPVRGFDNTFVQQASLTIERAY